MNIAAPTTRTFAADLIHFDFLDATNVQADSIADAAQEALAWFRSQAPYEMEDGTLQAEDITLEMVHAFALPAEA